MPARILIVLAAVIIALSAIGGAAYAGRAAADTSIVSDPPVADLDLNALLGSGDPNKRVIETAYEQVEHSYYEPVNPQLMVDGETKALNCLITDCVKRPATAGKGPLTAGRATGSSVHDLALMESAIDAVDTHDPNAGNRNQVTDAALGGMLEGLGDPYTTYLNADAIRALDEDLNGGNFGGIGVFIGKDPKTGAYLVDPIEGNPAIRAGIRSGDSILAVNDRPTTGLAIDDVMRLIEARAAASLRCAETSYRSDRDDSGNARRRTRPVGAREDRDGFSYVDLSEFGQTSATRCAPRSSRRRNKASEAIFSTCATTAAACSMRPSTSRPGDPPGPDRLDDRPRRTPRDPLGDGSRHRPLAAGRAGQQIHRQRVGDHRRGAPRRPPRHARRHQDVR